MKRKKILYADQGEVERALEGKKGKKETGEVVWLRREPIIFDVREPYYEIKIGKLVVPERPAEKDGE